MFDENFFKDLQKEQEALALHGVTEEDLEEAPLEGLKRACNEFNEPFAGMLSSEETVY